MRGEEHIKNVQRMCLHSTDLFAFIRPEQTTKTKTEKKVSTRLLPSLLFGLAPHTELKTTNSSLRVPISYDCEVRHALARLHGLFVFVGLKRKPNRTGCRLLLLTNTVRAS